MSALGWEPLPGHHPGQPRAHVVYVQADYLGMHCELYNPEGTDEWRWSFYDDDTPDPDMAVARGIEPTREAAEKELTDYIEGHLGDKGVDTVVVELEIDNVYPDETITTHWAGAIEAPWSDDEDSDDYQDWQNEIVFEKTGTGRTEGDAGYFVEVIQSSRPDLIPVGKKWEWC